MHRACCVLIVYVMVSLLPVDDPDNGRTLLGTLDYAWLFSYAIAMFFRCVCMCVFNLFMRFCVYVVCVCVCVYMCVYVHGCMCICVCVCVSICSQTFYFLTAVS